MYVYSFTGILELDNSDDCVEPTRECRRICNEEALQISLSSGRYPEYLGIEGPQDRNNPQTCNPLDFLFLLWPESLCDLIVDETNSYGRSKPNWLDIDRDELLTFFGLIGRAKRAPHWGVQSRFRVIYIYICRYVCLSWSKKRRRNYVGQTRACSKSVLGGKIRPLTPALLISTIRYSSFSMDKRETFT